MCSWDRRSWVQVALGRSDRSPRGTGRAAEEDDDATMGPGGGGEDGDVDVDDEEMASQEERLAGLIDFWWHPVEFRSFRAVAQPSENSPYLELSRNEQLIVIAVRKLR